MGLLCGCRKVNELVPSVRLARFHRESLPSLLGLPGGGETVVSVVSSDGDGCWDIVNDYAGNRPLEKGGKSKGVGCIQYARLRKLC